MKTIVVGGNYGLSKKSTIIQLLGESLNANIHNGGSMEDLKNISIQGYELVIWMPDISNREEKIYPKKDKGAVLICSKVLRDDRSEVDAVSRIFAMRGNAVIAIDLSQNPYHFKLIDALGNVWADSPSLDTLIDGIKKIYQWTIRSIRRGSKSLYEDKSDLLQLMNINKQIADTLEEQRGRYFGNLSTRCFKLFPSGRQLQNWILVSRRNVSKKRLTIDDMIPVIVISGQFKYISLYKPSVDTPIQMTLYNVYPYLNFMIHGHAHVVDAPTTEYYYPCGDLREVAEIIELIQYTKKGVINLKNHGFLMYSQYIHELQTIANKAKLINRTVGDDLVYKD